MNDNHLNRTQAVRESGVRELSTPPPANTLAERLGAERTRAFVGRARELEVFQRVLSETSHSLLFLTGQLGVGKSALLLEFQRLARSTGNPVLLLDAGQIVEQPVQQRLLIRQQVLERLTARSPNPSLRGVLLVDGFERLGVDDGWFLSELVPSLAGDALLVLASRTAAPLSLSLDPAWLRLMVLRHLAPFESAESARFLELRGVPASAHESISELTGGFPLGLAVAADLLARSPGEGFTLDCLQDVQHALAQMLSPPLVSPGQQLALDLCSLTRATTAELLENVRRSTGSDWAGEPEDLFNWLAHQSFINWTPIGLEPHSLMRLALLARLRRERPRRYRALRQAAREFCVTELETAANPASDFVNLFFLDRDVPLVRHMAPDMDHTTTRTRTLEPALERDAVDIVDLIGELEGEEAAALAALSLSKGSGQFGIIRGEQLEGALHFTRLDAEAGATRLSSKDPATASVRRFMAERPLQGDEASFLFRWFVDRENYQTPSDGVLAITGRQTQLLLATPNVPYSFCVFSNPADWLPLWNAIRLPWQIVDRFTLGGRKYSVLAFNWQQRSLRDVLLNAWRVGADNAQLESSPPLDELRIKVSERVTRLLRSIKLTPREAEILERLCLGQSFEEIARQLAIRPRTVKFHQENLLRKTGVGSRVELFRKLL